MNAYVDGIAYMLRVTHRAKHDLGVVTIMVYCVYTLLHERKSIMPLVLQPAHQRAYITSASMHGHIGLLQCIYKVYIYQETFVAEQFAGTNAFQGHRYFEYCLFRVEAQVQLAAGFFYHIFSCVAECLYLEHRYHFR